MKYGVRISDVAELEIDAGPGTPRIKRVELSFEPQTEDELRAMVPALGFDPMTMNPRDRLHVRHRLPLTRDGETEGSCTIHLWVGEELGATRETPPIEALVRLQDEWTARSSRREARSDVSAGE